MFATILRRWRIVTPLALAVLAIAVVAGGVLASASAHKVKFHFFGRAIALQDETSVLPDRACDTGKLELNGGSLDTGHCFGTFGPGTGTALTGNFRLESVFAEATVVSDSSKGKEGHVISDAVLDGPNGAHRFSADDGANTGPAGTPCDTEDNDIINTEGTAADAAADVVTINGVATNIEGTAADVDTFNTEGTPQDTENITNPLGVGELVAPCVNGIAPIPDRSLGEFGFGATSLTDVLYAATHTEEKAEAECQRDSHGQGEASARAVVTLVNPTVREDNQLVFLGPSGDPNETFPISGFNFAGFSDVSIVVIFNEQKKFRSGGVAFINANAVHIVGTNDDGITDFNLVLAHVFAGIHCAPHLPTDDAIGA